MLAGQVPDNPANQTRFATQLPFRAKWEQVQLCEDWNPKPTPESVHVAILFKCVPYSLDVAGGRLLCARGCLGPGA